jgi:hypothetical protein
MQNMAAAKEAQIIGEFYPPINVDQDRSSLQYSPGVNDNSHYAGNIPSNQKLMQPMVPLQMQPLPQYQQPIQPIGIAPYPSIPMDGSAHPEPDHHSPRAAHEYHHGHSNAGHHDDGHHHGGNDHCGHDNDGHDHGGNDYGGDVGGGGDGGGGGYD